MRTKTFSDFNLIPPKTKEELVTIEERDNSILYATFLVLFAVVIFTVLSLGKALLIDSRRDNLKSILSKQDSEILSYNAIKQINGEIFTKSNALAPIVEQDIKLTKLIDVSNKMVVNVPQALVTNYARELDGEFLLSLDLQSYSDINIISDNASKIENLENFYIISMVNDLSANNVKALISFKLINL